ncbi:hypothetical protein CONCODRAFT_165327 [Conidiobolus coronatus NRRL 28638]|uniref:Uncharacterized protein n=1 Tax=Conidiobolus coronatus (strain ATCC 28846 / CBS 209.66 / NRRL 28638) TaxID=796925 RepID=A0A137PGG3_CONC2|nr:hypothetical protein CONCODRAFT_165327 [Conidiobolus coronatus NRRL 28638]|eukprot:KXN74093.1 hypothetical protein CONCODRAFT_165327 [Conidiobolus coronatus NRRL 28638]
MKFYLSLTTFASLILGKSVKLTSPSKGDTWDAHNSLKLTWEKEGLDDRHNWAEVTLINANDKGIEWKFDYVTSTNNNSEFYLPANAFIEGSNYKLKVGIFSDVPISTPSVEAESEEFTIANGVNLDTYNKCNSDWKFTNVNSTTPWEDNYVYWDTPGKLTPANALDLRVKGVDDPNFTYTKIDLPAGGYKGGSYFNGELEDGKKYKLQGLFHYSRRIAGANPLCVLESEEFTYKKRQL